jgi:hypothetical protein
MSQLTVLIAGLVIAAAAFAVGYIMGKGGAKKALAAAAADVANKVK